MDVVTTMLSTHAMPADARWSPAGKRHIAIDVADYITATIGAPDAAGLVNGNPFVTPSAVVAA